MMFGGIPQIADNTKIEGILVVDHSSKLAGAELCLVDIVLGFGAHSSAFLFEEGPLHRELTARGLSVTISRGAGSFTTIKRDRNLARALPHLRGLVAVVLEIASYARRHRLVYANSQKAFVLASLATFLVRRPLVWHLHDIISLRHFGSAQRRLVVTLANLLAKCVIVPSKAAALAFIEAGGRASLVRIVANGLDMVRETTSVTNLRAELGLPDCFLFGVFSRLSPWKGQHIALEALAKLPDARCIIVGAALFGEDKYAEALRQKAKLLGIADRVLFLGHRSDVSRLMHAVDAVVHPSVEPEPFGRTLVEAMLCRVPVIAARNGAAPEILDEGRAGVLVPPGDADALASALISITKGTVASQEIVRRAEARALQLYNRPRMVSAIQQVVAPLASKGH